MGRNWDWGTESQSTFQFQGPFGHAGKVPGHSSLPAENHCLGNDTLWGHLDFSPLLLLSFSNTIYRRKQTTLVTLKSRYLLPVPVIRKAHSYLKTIDRSPPLNVPSRPHRHASASRLHRNTKVWNHLIPSFECPLLQAYSSHENVRDTHSYQEATALLVCDRCRWCWRLCHCTGMTLYRKHGQY